MRAFQALARALGWWLLQPVGRRIEDDDPSSASVINGINARLAACETLLFLPALFVREVCRVDGIAGAAIMLIDAAGRLRLAAQAGGAGQASWERALEVDGRYFGLVTIWGDPDVVHSELDILQVTESITRQTAFTLLRLDAPALCSAHAGSEEALADSA